MELLANTGTTNALGRCIRGPAIFLIPAAIHFIRSSTTSNNSAGPVSFPVVPPGPPKAIAENAHKIVQGVLALLPGGLLQWFCSKVLNLSEEVSENTVEYLKGRDTIWRILDQQTNGTTSRATTPEGDGSLPPDTRSGLPLLTFPAQETRISRSGDEEPAEKMSMDQRHPYHRITPEDIYASRQSQLPALEAANSYLLDCAWVNDGSRLATSASLLESNYSSSVRRRLLKEHAD